MALTKLARATYTPVEDDIYRTRAMQMFELRVAGKKNIEIAEIFKCDSITVTRHLAYAEREGLTRQYENDLVSLAALAIKVYRDKLTGDDPDPFVAKDVIDKLVKLGDRFAARESQTQEQTLRAYIEHKKLEVKTKDNPQINAITVPGQPAANPPPASNDTLSFEEGHFTES